MPSWLLEIRREGHNPVRKYYKTEKGARAAVDRISKDPNEEETKLKLYEQKPLGFSEFGLNLSDWPYDF